MDELKPCPFCGEQCAGLVISQGDKWARYEPSCLEVRTGYNISDDAPWRTNAIAAWNTRTPLQQSRNAVIEECAKLAESNAYAYEGGRVIAVAIRDLAE